MFNNMRFITKGVESLLDSPLQNALWFLIETMEIENRDYLQVFELNEKDGVLHVNHKQEIPPYKKVTIFPSIKPVTVKVFVIDDLTHSTMLLASEY